MSEKKRVPKKTSLEYTRPTPGTFTLETFPGVTFRFRKITIDDEAWVSEHFEGRSPWAIMTAPKAQAAELCRLYFHFLEDRSKEHFVPETKKERDYETGEEREVVVSGPRLFMQSIDGGNLTEMTLISHAFTKTILASRPISALPEEVKKSLQKWIDAQEKSEASQKATSGTDPDFERTLAETRVVSAKPPTEP